MIYVTKSDLTKKKYICINILRSAKKIKYYCKYKQIRYRIFVKYICITLCFYAIYIMLFYTFCCTFFY